MAAIDSNGLAAAVNKGTTEISATAQMINISGEKIPTNGATYQSVTGNTTLTVTPPPVYLFITSPVDGSTINAAATTVTGKILGVTPDVAITVNGLTATIIGDTYTVNNLPLTEGTNKITATATDQTGPIATQSVTVTLPPAIALTITAPTDWSSISKTRTTVIGTITNSTGNETGVTVNGVP